MVTATVFVDVLLTTGTGLCGFFHVLLRELIALPLLASASIVLLAAFTTVPWDIMADTRSMLASMTLGFLTLGWKYLAGATPGVETPAKAFYSF